MSKPNLLANSEPKAIARDNGIRSSSAISITSVLNASIGAEWRIGSGEEYLVSAQLKQEVKRTLHSILPSSVQPRQLRKASQLIELVLLLVCSIPLGTMVIRPSLSMTSEGPPKVVRYPYQSTTFLGRSLRWPGYLSPIAGIAVMVEATISQVWVHIQDTHWVLLLPGMPAVVSGLFETIQA